MRWDEAAVCAASAEALVRFASLILVPSNVASWWDTVCRLAPRGALVCCRGSHSFWQSWLAARLEACAKCHDASGHSPRHRHHRDRVVILGGFYVPGPGLVFEQRVVWPVLAAHVSYTSLNAYLSTLGGGHYLCRHTGVARRLAQQQLWLALRAGDDRQAVRCALHEVYIDMQEGQTEVARARVRRTTLLAVRLGLLTLEEAHESELVDLSPLWQGTVCDSEAESLQTRKRPRVTPLARKVATSVVTLAAPPPVISPHRDEVVGMLTAAAGYVEVTAAWIARAGVAAAAVGAVSVGASDDFARQRILPSKPPST